MNNKLNNNFSLRKLLLTALVAGPLATLPAPLWALPDISAANLQKSANVNVAVVGSSQLNVDAPDKAILSWTHFGDTSFYSGTSGAQNTFGASDVINFFLPTPTSSVLNIVTGNTKSQLDGTINSQGNVYFLNPAGIVIGATAQVNTGGFYASAVNEPPGYFSINGSLSYVGTSAGDVVVNGTGTTTGTDAATIQAIGPGNNIYLAGNSVNVAGGRFFGNLFIRSTSTTNAITNGANTGAVSFGQTGPVSVNLTGVPLVGGGLNVTTSGGSIVMTGDSARSLTIAGNVSSTTGAVSINTAGANGVNGSITQGNASFTANTTGTVVTLNAGTGTTAGNITLPYSDFLTVGLTGKNIVLADQANGVTLNAVTASGDLTIKSTGSINQGTGTHSVAGNIDLVASGGNTIAFTGTGNLTFRTLGSTSTVSITTNGDIVLPGTSVYTSTPTIQVIGGLGVGGTPAVFTPTFTGGVLTGLVITNAGSGYTSAPAVIITGGGGNASQIVPTITSGAITSLTSTTSPTTFQSAATAGSLNGTMSVVSTGGSITAGTITSSSTLNLTASQGSITAGAISSGTATFLAGNITVTTNPVLTATGNASILRNTGGGTMSVTASTGNISLQAASSSSTLNLTATAGSITVVGNTQSNTLNITAANGTVTLGTVSLGAATTISSGTITATSITSTTTARITLNSSGSIDLKTLLVPVLTVNSTTGSITQSGVITSTSSATFNAAGDITLNNAANALNTLVLQGGASGSAFSYVDADNIIIGSGTNTKVPTTIGTTTNGSITFGNAAIDVITFGSTLALNTTGSGNVTTNANTVSVFGNVNITNTGTGSVTLGNLFGFATSYTFGQVNATLAAGNLNVYENTTLNLGTITANLVDARSLSSDIVNTGTIKATTATFSAHDIFTPGNVSLTNAGNQIDTIVIGNAKDFTAVNSKSTVLTAGTNLVNGKAATGVVSMTVNGVSANSLVINTAAGGDYNVLSFTAPGNVTVTDPNGLTLQNLSNTSSNGGAAVNISAFGPIVLGSGINLGGTGVTTITSTYSSTNGMTPKISDSAAGVRIFGETIFRSDGGISITNAGHSFGSVSLITTGATSVATAPAAGSTALQDIVYTEGGTAVLKTVSVGTSTYPGSLTVTSTGGSIVQPLGGTVTVLSNSTTANTVSFTAGGGGVTLNANPTTLGTGTANLTGNTVTSVTPVTAGTNYFANSQIPLTFTGGGGTTTAVGYATTNATGAIVSYSITSAGSGYTSAPTVTIPAVTTGNSISPALNIAAVGNSAVTQSAQAVSLGNVTVTAGTFAVDTSNAAGITVAQATGSAAKVYGNTSVTTQAAKITLSNSTNNFGGLTLASNYVGGVQSSIASGTTSVASGTVSNVITLNSGGSTYAPSSTFAVTLAGGGGTGATATATTDATGKITSFTLTAAGTGYVSAPTIVVPTTGIQQGADIAIQEQGIMNLLAVNTGTLGKLSATSENASIIQSGTSGVIVGNTTTLTAQNGGITLASTANAFGGTAFGGGSILVSSGGNVSITDSTQNTVLNGNTTIGGGLTLKNSYGAQPAVSPTSFGSIRDTPGTLTVAGPVVFDAGLYSGSIVSIGSAVASFGAITFKGGIVTIIENSTLNIGAGSSAVGAVSLTSSGSIVTSGTANFQSTLNLNAGGNITISNSIFVQNGLTFKALGAVDLSALSLAGNLNSIAPINNGAASYKTPTP